MGTPPLKTDKPVTLDNRGVSKNLAPPVYFLSLFGIQFYTHSVSVQMGPDRAELVPTKPSCSNLLAQMHLHARVQHYLPKELHRCQSCSA